jgi:hypothetical protein
MNYSTSVPIKYILTVLISNLFLIQISKAQNFIPDNKGYIADPKFRTIIAEHGYQIVASFDTLKTKPLVIGAHAMKDGKLIIIDTKGNVLPETTIPAYIYTTVSKSNSQGSPDIAIDAPLEDKNELFEQDNQNGKVGTRNKVTKKPGLPAVYDGLVWWGNGVISIKQGEKMGVARTNGTVLFCTYL